MGLESKALQAHQRYFGGSSRLRNSIVAEQARPEVADAEETSRNGEGNDERSEGSLRGTLRMRMTEGPIRMKRFHWSPQTKS
ncbi:hypothetical protein GUJ93_ZPchr0004g39663 [Zizania palustris]|uniref:Uncharacterized protein n=1 Tax=Zizania palustris TaxID=103762 RepID=A0A8J5SF09_ZIZPA|nr:hypothetical protein GUJ93_ZPchr0004g39663 [Zizania palustris]